MSNLKYLPVFLFALLITTVSKADNSDEATLSKAAETSNIKDTKALPERKERILWPYPLKNESSPLKNGKNEAIYRAEEITEQIENNRQKRFLHWSYPQSPIVEMMLQTTAVNYKPQHGNDPFDFLRDSYPLPKGKFIYLLNYSRRQERKGKRGR